MSEMITIPKGGRPRKMLSKGYLEQLIIERQIHTVKQLAEMHEVSVSTMNRQLKEARMYAKESDK